MMAQDRSGHDMTISRSNLDADFGPLPPSPSPDPAQQGLLLAATDDGELFVVNDACCTCSAGTFPAMLVVTSHQTYINAPKTAANVEDKSFSNPFGWCKKKGALCKPVTPGPWFPGAPSASVGGIPALLQNDLLRCAKGGHISIQSAGQGTARYMSLIETALAQSVGTPAGDELRNAIREWFKDPADVENPFEDAPLSSPLMEALEKTLGVYYNALDFWQEGLHDGAEEGEKIKEDMAKELQKMAEEEFGGLEIEDSVLNEIFARYFGGGVEPFTPPPGDGSDGGYDPNDGSDDGNEDAGV
jgi:Domain of unknown function (DUF4280)